jgi:hypothetical protein
MPGPKPNYRPVAVQSFIFSVSDKKQAAYHFFIKKFFFILSPEMKSMLPLMKSANL